MEGRLKRGTTVSPQHSVPYLIHQPFKLLINVWDNSVVLHYAQTSNLQSVTTPCFFFFLFFLRPVGPSIWDEIENNRFRGFC